NNSYYYIGPLERHSPEQYKTRGPNKTNNSSIEPFQCTINHHILPQVLVNGKQEKQQQSTGQKYREGGHYTTYCLPYGAILAHHHTAYVRANCEYRAGHCLHHTIPGQQLLAGKERLHTHIGRTVHKLEQHHGQQSLS